MCVILSISVAEAIVMIDTAYVISAIENAWKILGNEPQHDKTNKLTCAPNKDSDQPGHPTSLIRVFAVCSMGS